jgi:hypothetical protein
MACRMLFPAGTPMRILIALLARSGTLIQRQTSNSFGTRSWFRSLRTFGLKRIFATCALPAILVARAMASASTENSDYHRDARPSATSTLHWGDCSAALTLSWGHASGLGRMCSASDPSRSSYGECINQKLTLPPRRLLSATVTSHLVPRANVRLH